MFFFQCLGGMLALLLFSSCATNLVEPGANRTDGDNVRTAKSQGKFHEEEKAEVVLRFAGWSSIRMLKPDTTEDGFMPVFNFEDAQRALAKPSIGRGLVVVVCGFGYNPEDEAVQQRKWSTVLGELGYQRVTFVRLGRGRRINGWAILNEVRLDGVMRAGPG